MNSRDAAYDEEKYQALIEASKADYGAKVDYDFPPRTPISAVNMHGGLNGHADPEHDPEPPVNSKKKRKRTDDDA